MGSDGIQGVGQSEHPGFERDLLFLQALGVARPVVSLVMVEDHVADFLDQFDLFDQPVSQDRVEFYLLPFGRRQAGGFFQDRVRDGDLADVVKQCALADIVKRFRVLDPGELGEGLAVLGDRDGVAEGFHVPQVEGGHQVFQRGRVDLLELQGLPSVPGPLHLEPLQVFFGSRILAKQCFLNQLGSDRGKEAAPVVGDGDLIDETVPEERDAGVIVLRPEKTDQRHFREAFLHPPEKARFFGRQVEKVDDRDTRFPGCGATRDELGECRHRLDVEGQAGQESGGAVLAPAVVIDEVDRRSVHALAPFPSLYTPYLIPIASAKR